MPRLEACRRLMARRRTAEVQRKTTQDQGLFGGPLRCFPTGRTRLRKIIVGAWLATEKSGTEQVVSQPSGPDRIH